jgi:hypothetical protein
MKRHRAEVGAVSRGDREPGITSLLRGIERETVFHNGGAEVRTSVKTNTLKEEELCLAMMALRSAFL